MKWEPPQLTPVTGSFNALLMLSRDDHMKWQPPQLTHIRIATGHGGCTAGAPTAIEDDGTNAKN